MLLLDVPFLLRHLDEAGAGAVAAAVPGCGAAVLTAGPRLRTAAGRVGKTDLGGAGPGACECCKWSVN